MDGMLDGLFDSLVGETNAFKELEKLASDLNEQAYQMKHRKFYMNNFKRKKRRKHGSLS